MQNDEGPVPMRTCVLIEKVNKNKLSSMLVKSF